MERDTHSKEQLSHGRDNKYHKRCDDINRMVDNITDYHSSGFDNQRGMPEILDPYSKGTHFISLKQMPTALHLRGAGNYHLDKSKVNSYLRQLPSG